MAAINPNQRTLIFISESYLNTLQHKRLLGSAIKAGDSSLSYTEVQVQLISSTNAYPHKLLQITYILLALVAHHLRKSIPGVLFSPTFLLACMVGQSPYWSSLVPSLGHPDISRGGDSKHSCFRTSLIIASSMVCAYRDYC